MFSAQHWRSNVLFYHRVATSHYEKGAAGQQVLCSYLCLTTLSVISTVGQRWRLPQLFVLTEGLMEKFLLLYLSSVAFTGKPLVYSSSSSRLCVWRKFESNRCPWCHTTAWWLLTTCFFYNTFFVLWLINWFTKQTPWSQHALVW